MQHNMSTWLVTLAAIAEYLVKARRAKEKLDEAKEEMKAAAEDLCSKWQGDAAQAFAQEQGVLYQYVTQLSGIGDEYMTELDRVRATYGDGEAEVLNAIRG